MKYFVVDTFTDTMFRGNPAGVCILDNELDDQVMQQIASENNLAETAFVLEKDGTYHLRWFTPAFEIDLCGHATLASAYVLYQFYKVTETNIEFNTSSGKLYVSKKGNLLELDFPIRKPTPIEITPRMISAVNVIPLEAYSSRDLFLVLKDEEQVRELEVNLTKLQLLSDWLGIIVTAPGKNVDFVSRYFCPELPEIGGEDPVTGSSHCSLIPLWAEKLQKKQMVAKQLSKRGGTLYCQLLEERVKISGEARLYLKGEITL